MNLSLRKSLESDLNIFFLNQTDEEANYMAAFTPKNIYDKEAYLSKWKKLMIDDTLNMQTILVEQKVVGCVIKFVMENNAEITYAISKEFWNKGIGSRALVKFLEIEKSRPIFGHVAFDNLGSQKILIKNGFEKIDEAMFYANARKKEIIEFVYKLG